jgi:hypothetical protein
MYLKINKRKYIFKSVKSPASGRENVRFPDSPDFENLPDFRTGRRALLRSLKDGDVIYGCPLIYCIFAMSVL